MNKLLITFFLVCFSTGVFASGHSDHYAVSIDTIPSQLTGNFEDDYGIRYAITDSVWTQLPGIRYHIIKWNTLDQYIIARNDAANPSEGGLYTRIDYISFTGMQPWEWGFCLTVYNAKTDTLAETTAIADRKQPRKGCNGFPFSRMKRLP